MSYLVYEVLQKSEKEQRLRLRINVDNTRDLPSLLSNKASFLEGIFSNNIKNQETFKQVCKLCKIPKKRSKFWYIYQADNYIFNIEVVEKNIDKRSPLFCDFDVYFTDSIYMLHINEFEIWHHGVFASKSLEIQEYYQDNFPQFKEKFEEIELSLSSSAFQLLKISSDNTKLFLGISNSELRVYRLENFCLLWSFNCKNLEFTNILENSEKEIIWLQNDNNIVKIFDLNTGVIINDLDLNTDQFVSSNGKYLANFYGDKQICIRDYNGNILHNIAYDKYLHFGTFINNSDLFFAIDSSGQITVIDITSGDKVLYFSIDKNKEIQSISFSPDNKFIIFCYKNECPEILNWNGDIIAKIGTPLFDSIQKTFWDIAHAYWTNDNKYFCLHFPYSFRMILHIFGFEKKKLSKKMLDNFQIKKENLIISLGDNIDKFHEARKALKSISLLNEPELSSDIKQVKKNLQSEYYWKRLIISLTKLGYVAEATTANNLLSLDYIQ